MITLLLFVFCDVLNYILVTKPTYEVLWHLSTVCLNNVIMLTQINAYYATCADKPK